MIVRQVGAQVRAGDRAGRLTQQTLDGNIIATPTYVTPGQPNEHTIASVNYPAGIGNAGNNTTGTYLRNTNGQLTKITWTGPAGTITSDEVTRSQSGRIIDQKIDGVDPYTTGNNYTYDTAGRLTAARAPGGTYYQYGYATSGGCGANTAAGANSNRTTATVNGTTVATFCYDNADRLTSLTSTTAPYNAYTLNAHFNLFLKMNISVFDVIITQSGRGPYTKLYSIRVVENTIAVGTR